MAGARKWLQNLRLEAWEGAWKCNIPPAYGKAVSCCFFKNFRGKLILTYSASKESTLLSTQHNMTRTAEAEIKHSLHKTQVTITALFICPPESFRNQFMTNSLAVRNQKNQTELPPTWESQQSMLLAWPVWRCEETKINPIYPVSTLLGLTVLIWPVAQSKGWQAGMQL